VFCAYVVCSCKKTNGVGADGDPLYGEHGVDALFGGTGNDYFVGGSGSDFLCVM